MSCFHCSALQEVEALGDLVRFCTTAPVRSCSSVPGAFPRLSRLSVSSSSSQQTQVDGDMELFCQGLNPKFSSSNSESDMMEAIQFFLTSRTVGVYFSRQFSPGERAPFLCVPIPIPLSRCGRHCQSILVTFLHGNRTSTPILLGCRHPQQQNPLFAVSCCRAPSHQAS